MTSFALGLDNFAARCVDSARGVIVSRFEDPGRVVVVRFISSLGDPARAGVDRSVSSLEDPATASVNIIVSFFEDPAKACASRFEDSRFGKSAMVVVDRFSMTAVVVKVFDLDLDLLILQC